MSIDNKIKVGIGFATGRRSFQKVLKTYIYNFRECGLSEKENVELNLLVAYDLKYKKTKSSDYTNVSTDLTDLMNDTHFIGKTVIQNDINYLVSNNVITQKQANSFFGRGYAAKRNSLLYTAIKNGLHYLIFLDDDEYPMAVTNTKSSVIWGGQNVISTHLKHIKNADITNGYHCGYISPIPSIEFNDTLKITDFRLFVEALSNESVTWDTIKSTMDNGGVTYADTNVLVTDTVHEIEEIYNTKFISGANLCINLTNPKNVCSFYNPPGARGEDTFFSTSLNKHKVLRVPCYTFHDGFSTYNHLMDGVLPIRLKYIRANSEQIISRFYRACIGWIRYKPLLLYITQQEQYDKKIDEMRNNLNATLPKLCKYFKCNDFNNILKEFEGYNRNVKKHYNQYIETQKVWSNINEFLVKTQNGT